MTKKALLSAFFYALIFMIVRFQYLIKIKSLNIELFFLNIW
jgi:hypothetical protein